jgi:hypothetical protein
MEPKMSSEDSKKYGFLKLDRGGLDRRGRRRSPIRTRAEISLDDRMVDRFRATAQANGRYPSRAIEQIVGGVQKPWSTTARRVIEMVQEGVPVEVIKAAAVYEMERFVDELVTQPDRAA